MTSVVLMIIWVGASVIASQVFVGNLMLSVLGADQLGKPLWTAIYTAVVYSLTLVLVVLIPHQLAKKRKSKLFLAKRDELGLRGAPTWTDIGLAPVGMIVYMILAYIMMAIFSIFPWFNATETQDIGFNYFIVGMDRVLAFIATVVIAPIAEEVIFRGWLYGKMRKKLSNETIESVSVIASSLLVSVLFGLIHLQWNVGVNVFAMSMVACALREVTGTIYASIFLHMLKNGIAFYLLYVLGMGFN